jgi:hypothetical protein
MIVNLSTVSLMNMNAVTFNAGQFKIAGSFISPQQPLYRGTNRSISFVFDGVYAVELWRGPADVPNSMA